MHVSYHAPLHRSARQARAGGPAVLIALSLSLASCGPPQEPRTPPEEPPAPVEPGVPQARPLLDASAALPVVVGPVETVEHFGERLVGELRLPEAAWEAYQRRQELPDGTQIALRLRSVAAVGPDEALQVLWMEKSGGAWRFNADRGDGLAFEGTHACQRCHSEAPVDFVFRIPAPQPAPQPAQEGNTLPG